MPARQPRNQVRIISGKWRGRRVRFEDSAGLRPTPDRVRETLFNWLNPHLTGARVLDLFAGSGVLGFEALSRGAGSAVAVEQERRVVHRLECASKELDAEGYEVVCADALQYLRRYSGPRFDILFLDPPHSMSEHVGLYKAAERADILNDGAYVYLEFPKGRDVDPPRNWDRWKSSTAGSLVFQLWQIPSIRD